MKIWFANILFLLFPCVSLQAQDIHFSDFYSSPLNLNPALTGMFNGNLRVASMYRDQYRSVAVPYQTFTIGVDAKKDNVMKLRNVVGYGLLFNVDQAGDAEYQNIQFIFPFSLQLKKRQNKAVYSAGIGIGGTFSSIYYEKLRFVDQFDGEKYESVISHGEEFVDERLFMPVVIAGGALNIRYHRFNSIKAGISVHNLVKPQTSWFDNNEVKLQNRFSAFVLAPTMGGKKSFYVPSVKYTYQGKQQELQFGGQVFSQTRSVAFNTINCGLWLRALDWDALILNLGFVYSDYQFGFSYDVNLSGLRPASDGRGAFEISVVYIKRKYKGRRKKASVKCPGYL